ncbi:MAG: NADH-quinone oxidoreductase subunit N [Thermoanaerobaculia bacterium]|nr:NADH-quinone oxidoreductase subunit N [Thermoanaerobaculia bacterium]
MTGTELVALIPLMVLAGAAVLVLLSVAWRRSHGVAAGIAALGFVAAGGLVPLARARGAVEVTMLLRTDGLHHLFTLILCAAGLVCALLARSYFRDGRVSGGIPAGEDASNGSQPGSTVGNQGAESGGSRSVPQPPEELYALLLMGTLGAAVLAGSVHFASLFLGLEILSVSLYGLVAYTRHRDRALEAGIKYLILAGASSAFLLFGVALVYAVSGRLDLAVLAELLGGPARGSLLAAAGLGLLFVAVGFKLALVPFHLWTPDVYQGAPAPATAFVASVSKAGIFALAVRLFLTGEAAAATGLLYPALAAVAVASMVLGNLLALLQEDLKRLLAYSSIAHLGYLLVALLAGGSLGLEGGIYYLVAYLVTILAAFGVVATTSTGDSEPSRLESYRGLFWHRPGLATVLTVALLSLAGIPLTAGFLGKLYVLAAGVGATRWVLTLTLALTSAVGLFYYLRVVVVMLTTTDEAPDLARTGILGGAVLTVLTLLLLGLGTWPPALIATIRAMVSFP